MLTCCAAEAKVALRIKGGRQVCSLSAGDEMAQAETWLQELAFSLNIREKTLDDVLAKVAEMKRRPVPRFQA